MIGNNTAAMYEQVASKCGVEGLRAFGHCRLKSQGFTNWKNTVDHRSAQ